MTLNLFKKAAVFGDIHYGLKNNSKIHNDDCDNFVDWFCEQAISQNCETCIFLGDLYHTRNSINVSTLNYGFEGIKKLSKSFEKVYLILGNHDIYFREKRDLYSYPFATSFKNVKVINEVFNEGNTTLVPWLVEEEWKEMSKINSKYIFGHFELPHFKMNEMVEMPDHGRLKKEDFTKPEYVFSGHFHKRQNNGIIHYVGSPFAHNYADVWDDDRGMMVLEWGKTPVYTNWKDGPKYININLSSVLENPDDYLSNKLNCKILIDIPISYEESNFIKETFVTQYNLRELSLIPQKTDEHAVDWGGDNLIIENVDQIVISQLSAVDSEFINKEKLMEIYLNL